MTTREELTVLALVACDYSYNPNPAINDVLSTYRDSEPDGDYLPPDHLFTNVGIK